MTRKSYNKRAYIEKMKCNKRQQRKSIRQNGRKEVARGRRNEGRKCKEEMENVVNGKEDRKQKERDGMKDVNRKDKTLVILGHFF